MRKFGAGGGAQVKGDEVKVRGQLLGIWLEGGTAEQIVTEAAALFLLMCILDFIQ